MFEVGDIVRLKTGKSLQQVRQISTHGQRIRAEYLSRLGNCGSEPGWRVASDYVHVAHHVPMEKEELMTQLYQTKALPNRFGTQIATNSKGQKVLEMRGENGGVEAFYEGELEEVMPYTVELSMLGGERSTSKSIIAKPDQVEKDEVLLELNTGLLWRVTLLDSKARAPKENKSQWLKVPTTKVTFGSME